MKGRQLLDAMAYIDDAMIEEAAPLLGNEQADTTDFASKRRIWKGITACAAVFAVTVVSLWVWKSGIVSQERSVLERGQNAGAYDVSGADRGDDINAEDAPVEAPIIENKEVEIDDIAAVNEGAASGAVAFDGVSSDSQAVGEASCKDGTTDDFAEETKDSIVRVIEEFHLPAVYCYAAPEKGSSIICAELRAAIDCYDYDNNTIELVEPESYLYHVAIQVFGEIDGENGDELTGWSELQFSEEGREKLYEEYERMLSEGLDVSLSENCELTGMLNHEEIENFAPCPEYGYMFRLVNEY